MGALAALAFIAYQFRETWLARLFNADHVSTGRGGTAARSAQGGEGRSRPLGALGVTLVVLALTVVAWVGYQPGGEAIQLREDYRWVDALRIRYTMGIDGISLAMIALTAFLMPLAIRASWHQSNGFLVCLLFLETGMMGAFCALDLFLFYVFWEAMLLPMYLLIGIWGGPRRIYALVKFIIYTIVGSVLLAAIIYGALRPERSTSSRSRVGCRGI
jgi:NADH-quinone oxidoreductase subunit M